MSKDILLIEDDKAQQLAWKQVFEHLGGFDVRIANNGKEGLIKLDENLSLIVLDMSMPIMNGIEFLNELANSKYHMFHHIPIIALTVWHDDEEVRQACNKHKNVKLLSKDLDRKLVVEKAKHVLKKMNYQRKNAKEKL